MGAITFAVKAPPVPEWSGWTDFTDPVYWTVTEGSWDGVKWITEFTDPYYDWKVEPLGTGPRGAWWENAKPTWFRITFSNEPGTELYLRSDEPDLLQSDNSYPTLEEQTVDYDFGVGGPWDIASLQLRGWPDALEITKIEFYAP